MDADAVAANQRARLVGAMVAAVASHGYPATTVDELGALAGVSKRAFYTFFDSKQACFFAAFDQIMETFSGEVERAAADAEGFRGQLIASIETLADTIDAISESVSLVLVDSLSVGPAADDPRQRSQDRFAALLGLGFESSGGAVPSEATRRAIVVGLRRIAYGAIRDRDGQRLREAVGELADWILAFGESSIPAPEPTPRRGSVPTSTTDSGWEEPPDSPTSRMELSQRERIMRAIVQLVCRDGYAKLTIPAISATAGTSNKTFYDEFEGKEEAFLAGFDTLAEAALVATRSAFARGSGWGTKADAALSSYLDHLVTERLFAELAYLQMPAMGRPGLERLDAFMNRLAAIFEEGAPLPASRARVDLVRGAIVGGVWGTIRFEIMNGRREHLARIRPQLIGFISTGLGA